MIEYNDKKIYKNSLYSFLYKIISMILSFISAPLLLSCLGEEKYGIWITLGSIISWIYYSDLGIGSGLRNKLSYSLGKNDIKSAKGYIATSYILLTVISIVLFFLFVIFVSIFDVSKILNINISENISLCLIVALFFSCLNFIFSLANNLAYAEQRASLVSFFNLLGQGLYVSTLFVFLKSRINLILYIAIGEGVCQVIKNILETHYILKKYPELRVTFSNYHHKYTKGILSFGLLVFISQISSLIHNTTDNILIAYFFGSMDVTPYNFCFKFFNLINTLYLVLLTPLVSAYTVAKSQENMKWIRSAMNKSMILYSLFFISTIVAIFIFRPFARIWLGRELEYSNGLIIFTCIYFLMLMLSHNTTSLQTGLGDLKMATVAVTIGALLNIPASIFCAVNLNFGVSGIVMGSVISMIPVLAVGLYKYIYYKRIAKNEI